MTKDERKANRADWTERIADFTASGLSAPQWCAAHDLKVHQLRYWLKKLQTPAPAQALLRWLPVDLHDPEPTLTVRIGAAAIEVRNGFDPQLLITVIRTLSAR